MDTNPKPFDPFSLKMISASTTVPYLLKRTTRSGFLKRKGRFEMCSLLLMSLRLLGCLLAKRRSEEHSGVGKRKLSVGDFTAVKGDRGGVDILKVQLE